MYRLRDIKIRNRWEWSRIYWRFNRNWRRNYFLAQVATKVANLKMAWVGFLCICSPPSHRDMEIIKKGFGTEDLYAIWRMLFAARFLFDAVPRFVLYQLCNDLEENHNSYPMEIDVQTIKSIGHWFPLDINGQFALYRRTFDLDN